MGTETSGVVGLSSDPRPRTLHPAPNADNGTSTSDDHVRLKQELEQLHVTVEDMEARMQELIHSNGELQSLLAIETRQRALAESRIQELLAASTVTPGATPGEISLRC